jgi:hypothetical protein
MTGTPSIYSSTYRCSSIPCLGFLRFNACLPPTPTLQRACESDYQCFPMLACLLASIMFRLQ